jgi:phage tail-like protein
METNDSLQSQFKIHFLVQFEDRAPVRFQEIGGAESQTAPEYRHGNSPIFYPLKMPGLGRVGNVTMRKGVFVGDGASSGWSKESSQSDTDPQTIAIHVIDSTGSPIMVWTLINARPLEVNPTEVQSEGNEIAIESVEIAYETMVISAP